MTGGYTAPFKGTWGHRENEWDYNEAIQGPELLKSLQRKWRFERASKQNFDCQAMEKAANKTKELIILILSFISILDLISGLINTWKTLTITSLLVKLQHVIHNDVYVWSFITAYSSKQAHFHYWPMLFNMKHTSEEIIYKEKRGKV